MKVLNFSIIFFFFFIGNSNAQINQKFTEAFKNFQNDKQFAHSLTGLTIADSKTGKVLFENNGEVGLVPASTLKLITSTSSYQILGADYNYKTYINLSLENNIVRLQIKGAGDPTIGSSRWAATNKSVILNKILSLIKSNKLNQVNVIYIDDTLFTYQPVPNGWTYEDIGNYFGAGAWGLNWNENTYNLLMNVNAATGSLSKIVSSDPEWIMSSITNFVTIGEKGSGDNSLIFSTPYQSSIFMNGTLAQNASPYTISGSLPDPGLSFGKELIDFLAKNNIEVSSAKTYSSIIREKEKFPSGKFITTDSIISPAFESMDYWFLHKSLNLYGECFVKSIALSNGMEGSTKNGVEVIRGLWEKNGIERSALNIVDGSGLSPANRITTNALVNVLEFARKQNWYSSFHKSLPEMNGIKMKSGYIGGVRSYAGYIKSKTGNEYSFAFIVNNFDGSPASVREKMWKLLDLLK